METMYLTPVEDAFIFDKPNYDQTVGNAFVTALLLTRNCQQAEAAVLEMIRFWNPEVALEASLPHLIGFSIDVGGKMLPLKREELDSVASMLPLGLHGVLHLPLELRYCFVLRMLVGLSRMTCARMLHMHPREVDRYTCAALRGLPALKARAVQTIGWHLLFRPERTYYDQTQG